MIIANTQPTYGGPLSGNTSNCPVPREVMLQRIATRSTNPYGKRAHEQQCILADLKAVEPLLRVTSTVEIVTTIPVTEVVDALESIARRADDGGARRFTHP